MSHVNLLPIRWSSHCLVFNAAKTQLIKFLSCPSQPMAESQNFVFCGQSFGFSQSMSHIGHILGQDLYDNMDIRKICVERLITCYFLPAKIRWWSLNFYEAFASPFAVQPFGFHLVLNSDHFRCLLIISLEKSGGYHPHAILHLHLVAGVPSVHNLVISRSINLIKTAVKCVSPLVADVFEVSSKLVYTSAGYNQHCGHMF